VKITTPRTAAFLAPLLVLLAPALAGASEGEAHHPWSTFFWHLANLVVFIFILVKYVGPQLRAFLFQRRKTISSQLEGARRLLADAEARDAEWAKKIEGLQAESERIGEQAREMGRLERERILEQARAQAERIRQGAERAARQELARAKGQLREEAVRLAMVLAERMVQDNLNGQDQKRLVEEYLENMERIS
jgi:F-type H+-transporting ATPase subunit b